MSEDEPYQIHIVNPDSLPGVHASLIRQSILATLQRFDIPRAAISVAVVTDAHIARLHKEFMDDENPTDVLTFDMSEAPSDGKSPVLDGEIVVSAETAMRLAGERGHSVEAELALYAVHGILHLVGLDDTDEQKSQEMHRVENEILTQAGVGPVYGSNEPCE